MPRGIARRRGPHGVGSGTQRALLWIYNHDRGPLLGRRFLYLAHQGRLTGLRREIVLKTMWLDHDTGEVVVFSGDGNRPGWIKDLRAGRALEIRLGHLRFSEPEHRFLPDEERRALLVAVKEARPVTWPSLAVLMRLPEDPKNDDIGAVRAVAFRPVRWPVAG